MMRPKTLLFALAVLLTFSIAIHAQPPRAPASNAYKQIEQTLGFVPQFMRAVPDEALPAAFEEMRVLEMSDTALSMKTKELIGLGVAAQVPCTYCVYAHTQFAKANGATEREIKEAVAMAAITRHWSTVLNGMEIDKEAFDKETQRTFAHMRKQQKAAPAKEMPIKDAQSAYKDIEATLGAVPAFMKAFPSVAIAPAWREMKAVQLNPNTALDGKAKELIGLGVAAQVPCDYCVRFHTMAARHHGASQQEIQEAVAMAALTRHWSTFLQGSRQDEAQFRRDIDRMVKTAKDRPKTQKQATR